MQIAVVIPGLNEEKYLQTVLTKVAKYQLPVIFVDDGSNDKTVYIAKKHATHVLVHEVNVGKGAALKTGCEYAFEFLQMDAVIFMDSDDQHDPRELPHFCQELESGSPMVYGVRQMGNETPWLRSTGNKMASWWMKLLFGAYVPDIPSGYKALTRETYQSIEWKSNGYEVEAEIAARAAQAGIPFSVLPIESIYHDTDKGMTFLDAIRVAAFLIQLRIG